MEAKLEQSTAAMAAMHQALIESQEAQGKLVAAEREGDWILARITKL